MSVWAAILMAGSGSRFGGDKVSLIVRGKPLWRYSFEALLAHPEVAGVGLVCAADRVDALRAEAPEAGFVVEGGADRMSSSRRAVEAMPDATEIALIHDAARPMVFPEVVSSVIEAARRAGGAAPAIDCVDTARMVEKNGERLLLDRRTIKLMQTPQGAKIGLLRGAYDAPGATTATDEMALLEAVDVHPELVAGRPESLKIPYPADLARFAGLLGAPETRTGIGYDTHVFSSDPQRALWLGGVHFEGERGLEGQEIPQTPAISRLPCQQASGSCFR